MAAKKNKQAATAAPKAITSFEVCVKDADTNRILEGAKITVTGGKAPLSGKTNKKGLWTSKAVPAGTYEITATVDHYGPPVVQPAPPLPPVSPIAGPAKVSQTVAPPATKKTPVEIRMGRSDFAVKIIVVDETYSKLPVYGASILLDGKAALQPNGKVAGQTDPWDPTIIIVSPGEHTLRITRLGFSQSTATPNPDVLGGKISGVKSSKNVMKTPTEREPGAVDYVVNLLAPPKAMDLELGMTNDWHRVSNGTQIQVGGADFATWYNGTFQKDKKYKYPSYGIKNTARFTDVFNNVAQFRAEPLTLEEFIGIFMVMMVEVGGTFTPIAEGGTLDYFFEKRGKKASYNQGANRKAGNLLAGIEGNVFSPAILTPAVPATATKPEVPNDKAAIAQWNSTTYPASLGKVKEANLWECDFAKYRGHSYIQVTWHDSYVAAQEFVRLIAARCNVTGANNAEILDKISSTDLQNAIANDSAICFALMVGWFDQANRWKSYLDTNRLRFAGLAKRIGGIGYGDFDTWCKDLRTAMTAAGPNLGPLPSAPGPTPSAPPTPTPGPTPAPSPASGPSVPPTPTPSAPPSPAPAPGVSPPSPPPPVSGGSPGTQGTSGP